MVSIGQMDDDAAYEIALTGDLARRLAIANPSLESPRQGMGVVMIDEIELHLHPSWQRNVIPALDRTFPNCQFIVTTHSPLVCQAAEHGSVWRLPTPGDDSPSGRVTGIERKRLIYGSILEAFGTELFGEGVTRSDSSKEMLARLAQLNYIALKRDLSAEEARELEELRAMLPTAAGVMDQADGGDR